MNQTTGYYKYRGGNDEVFERDLKSLENNCFWAPNHMELNDPCETLVSEEMIRSQIDSLEKLLGSDKSSTDSLYLSLANMMNARSRVGIYCLSTLFNDELLWAHYANAHKGFCIQYDLDLLTNPNMYQKLKVLPIDYKMELPSINIEDILKGEDLLSQKVFGTKSKLWKYEKEVRIITNKVGENDYDCSAVVAIYFGCRMLDQHKMEMMRRLKGRGINYFQMKLEENSYQFTANPINDLFENAQPYLCQIPKEIGAINYKITDKSYCHYSQKGTINIKLECKISEEQLGLIALQVKEKIFRNAERVLMLYSLPDLENGNRAWATTHFESDQFDIQINGLTIEQEEKLVGGFEADTRDVIGRWLDNSPFLSKSLTLFRSENGVFLENIFSDGSSQTKELRPTKLNEGIRYDDIQGNSHGEYYTVDNHGILHFFSSDDQFMELKPHSTSKSPQP